MLPITGHGARMPIYLRKRDLPELAGLPPEQADARLRAAQERLGLKPALLSSALFGGLTVVGLFVGRAFGQQLAGTLIGWVLGLGVYQVIKLNAARPLLRDDDPHGP